MNIPPKYEDVVAQLEAAMGHEAALRGELATIRADRDAEKKMKAKARDQRDVQTIRACELQQRLTVAEQLLSEIVHSGDWHSSALEFIDCDGFDILEKIEAALKPAAEQAKNCPNCKVCMGSPDFPENCLINGGKP